MFMHLSSTSPYVCDVSLGPIEQANRMASAPTETSKSYLGLKESHSELQPIRTPLKLLAPDEFPTDNSMEIAKENNSSRQQSLQPVWYNEQTIVDDNNGQSVTHEHHGTSIIQEQNRNSTKAPCHHHELTCSILPTIESTSPDIEDEIIVKESVSSLMRKSSTFTIEHSSSNNTSSTLNESEKENHLNTIITSRQEESTSPIHHPTEPSDESFRALEHLLGLGSTNASMTMTTSTQDSPKSNHESLSLTIVTPTELINQTTTSIPLSYAPVVGAGSLPSSQNVPLMPTIESITDPSMNSTTPAPFLVDNSDIEEPSSTAGTIINQETMNENSNYTDDSFNFTDEDDEKHNTPKDDSNIEDDSNFSFELNDFPNSLKDEVATSSTEETNPLPPLVTIRAPTSTDVALRALIKPRTSGRISQPVKARSPLAKTDKTKSNVRSSAPILNERVPRSSSHRISKTSLDEEFNKSNTKVTDEYFTSEHTTNDNLQMIRLSEEDKNEYEQTDGIILNRTRSEDDRSICPNSADEADRSASSSSSYVSTQQDLTTPTSPKMPILSREYTYNTPTARIMHSSERRRPIITTRSSTTHSTHSMISTISERQITLPEEEKDSSSENTSICSSLSSKVMLSKLSTNPTVISEASPMILQKSLVASASPSPSSTPIITIRKSERIPSSVSPRRSINPLHSSTPSIRNRSLQMVSIDEQEQILTTVPQNFNVHVSKENIKMFDKEQQIDIPIQVQTGADKCTQTSPERRPYRIDTGIQTTPTLDPSVCRRFQTIEQQTTPVVTYSSSSSSCQTTPIAIAIRQIKPTVDTSSKMMIEEEEYREQQVTPVHTKAMMHLRRNVRFQFTPSTDARLAAKEKLEEEQRQMKEQILIDNPKEIQSDNEHEEDTEDEMKRITKIKKKMTTSRKKKYIAIKRNDDSSEETNESPIRNQPHNDAIIQEQQTINDNHVTSTTRSKKQILKRSIRRKDKYLPISESETVVTTASSPLITTRSNRKRPNHKSSNFSSSETISSIEPVTKQVKTKKTVENKQSVRVPSPKPRSTRSRSKAPMILKNNISSSESIEQILPRRKAKKDSVEITLDNSWNSMKNKRKTSASTVKQNKRRLHSVEQDEGLNTADEEETNQIISQSIEFIPIDFNQEEREKIEGLTVVELKNRLIRHGENIPKGARKAELVALLIQIETNLLKKRKEAETTATATFAISNSSTSRKKRRKK